MKTTIGILDSIKKEITRVLLGEPNTELTRLKKEHVTYIYICIYNIDIDMDRWTDRSPVIQSPSITSGRSRLALRVTTRGARPQKRVKVGPGL